MSQEEIDLINEDALWCIRSLDYDAEIQAFALRCIRLVEHFDKSGSARKCNYTLEKYLNGGSTEEELNIAVRAASIASAASAAYAVSIAAWAARAASNPEIATKIEQDFLTTFCQR